MFGSVFCLVICFWNRMKTCHFYTTCNLGIKNGLCAKTSCGKFPGIFERISQSSNRRQVPMPKEVMLCFWWENRCVIYYVILFQKQTINSDVFCLQLINLKKNTKNCGRSLIIGKSVVLQQDKFRAHTSLST